MSVARGILTGFLKEGLEQKAARDEMYADLAVQAGIDVRENINLFRKEEDNIEKRFNLVKANHGINAALYASYNKILDSDAGANMVIKDLKENPGLKKKIEEFDFQNYDFNTDKTQRFMNFNQQQKKVLENLGNNQFPVPVAELTFKDMKSMDAGAQVARPELDLPNLSEFGAETGSDFTEKGEFRIRQNNAVERAIQVSGLNSKISKDDFGNISVTAIDEADQGKLDFITSETTKRYSQNFKRLDFANIGNESVAYVNTLDRSSKGFKDETDKIFASYQLEASSELANSENKVIPLEGGQKITAYELFLNKNDTLLRLYKEASTQGRRFIKKQYNALTPNKSGYYSFFKRIDEELEKDENS